MVGSSAKENYARERIVLAISLFQKNALPVITKYIKSLMSKLHIAYKALVRMCSANGGLRRFGIAKARQLAGCIAFLATQLTKWRRLIEFVAAKVMYIKDMAKRKAPVAECASLAATENLQDPAYVHAVEEPDEPTEPVAKATTTTQENDNMNALAQYSALDAIQAKNAISKSPSKKKKDKIAARRRR